jgi:hypothetical protein
MLDVVLCLRELPEMHAEMPDRDYRTRRRAPTVYCTSQERDARSTRAILLNGITLTVGLANTGSDGIPVLMTTPARQCGRSASIGRLSGHTSLSHCPLSHKLIAAVSNRRSIPV